MDNRPVIVRTDESAQDFWSRERHSANVSPDFKIMGNFAARVQKETPFGQQNPPRHVARAAPIRTSRSIERIVFQNAIGELEDNAGSDENSAPTIIKLRAENAHLRLNLDRALRINHALTRHMLDSNKS